MLLFQMEQSFQQEIENLKKDLFESQGRIDALKEQLESTVGSSFFQEIFFFNQVIFLQSLEMSRKST